MTKPMSDERLAEIRREYDDSPTTEVADLLAEVERLRGQTKRVRTYAREGCLGSKSTIYNRVGRDLLCIVGKQDGDRS